MPEIFCGETILECLQSKIHTQSIHIHDSEGHAMRGQAWKVASVASVPGEANNGLETPSLGGVQHPFSIVDTTNHIII